MTETPVRETLEGPAARATFTKRDLDALEQLIEQFRPEVALEWLLDVDDVNSGWNELEHVGQIAELVHRIGDGDWMVVKTKEHDPRQRYAQLMGNGERFHVEVAVTQPDGVHNFRMGYGEGSVSEGNCPGTGPGESQWLTREDAIDVVSAWARGGRFLPGYGACLHLY
jgi:hypothetical protein